MHCSSVVLIYRASYPGLSMIICMLNSKPQEGPSAMLKLKVYMLRSVPKKGT